MRKLAVITGAALALAGTWTAVAGQYNDISTQPSANAYVSMDFGHPNPARAQAAPLHYGLRMSYDQRLRAVDGSALPALAQWDFDSHGNRIAMVGGIPFMAHIRPPLRQTEGEGGETPSGGGSEGLDFFDLSLLVVGVGAIGYLIYEVSKNDDSEAVTTTGGTPCRLLCDLLNGGGVTSGGTTGGYAEGTGISADRDVERLRWLDGGSGHMGELQTK